jgi:hypothetical protein
LTLLRIKSERVSGLPDTRRAAGERMKFDERMSGKYVRPAFASFRRARIHCRPAESAGVRRAGNSMVFQGFLLFLRALRASVLSVSKEVSPSFVRIYNISPGFVAFFQHFAGRRGDNGGLTMRNSEMKVNAAFLSRSGGKLGKKLAAAPGALFAARTPLGRSTKIVLFGLGAVVPFGSIIWALMLARGRRQ